MDLEKFETEKHFEIRINGLKHIRNRLYIIGNPEKTAELLNSTTNVNKHFPNSTNPLFCIGLPSEEDFLYFRNMVDSRIAYYEDLFKNI